AGAHGAACGDPAAQPGPGAEGGAAAENAYETTLVGARAGQGPQGSVVQYEGCVAMGLNRKWEKIYVFSEFEACTNGKFPESDYFLSRYLPPFPEKITFRVY